MKRVLILIICVITSINSNSQDKRKISPKVTVTGKVIDTETKQALEYATIIFTPIKLYIYYRPTPHLMHTCYFLWGASTILFNNQARSKWCERTTH